MADPTEYDLVQDEAIQELQDVVTVSANPIGGAEYSFPIPNYPVNQEQFQLLSLVSGNGVIDRGGRPYWLTGHGSDSETNAQNSMILKVSNTVGRAEAVVAGYYHVLTQDKTISLPPVTSKTTYRICLTYDPREEEGRVGPVSIQVYDTEPPTSSGRVHVVLWSVTRAPNQLLTEASVTRERPRIAPTTYVYYKDHLPDANTQLSGALCVVGETASTYRVSSDDVGGEGNRAWVNLTSPTWQPLRLANVRESAGHGYPLSYQIAGTTVKLRGHIRRSNGENFKQSLQSELSGWDLGILPPEATPKYSVHALNAVSAEANPKYAKIVIHPGTGIITAFVSADCSWISLDNIQFDLE